MNTELSAPADSPAVQNGAPHAPASRTASAAIRPHSPGIDAIDSILWRLEARGGDEKSLVLGVTGCGPRTGATTVAANLALCAGAQGCRVLLVSTAPSGRKAREGSDLGLSDILSGDTSPRECQPAEIAENVFALSCGSTASAARANPSLVAEMLEEFKSQYDVVIVDLPPAENLGSALPLAKQLPGVVLVVCSERTSQRDAQDIVERLAEDGVSIHGTVLNQYKNHVPRWLRRWF